MKVWAINYIDKKTPASNIALKGVSQPLFKGEDYDFEKVSVSKLEDYKYAKAYYNHRLETKGQLFDDEKFFEEVMSDNKSQRNLFYFIRENAEEEFSKLNQKSNLTQEEKDKLEGYKEIIRAFPSAKNNIPSSCTPQVSFTGVVTDEQRKKCHIAIHGAAAACGAISAAAGEASAFGGETFLLRGAQALMFFYMKDLLGIDHISNLLYMSRQYVQGCYLGTRGVQILAGMLGIGGHVASGGTASPAVTSGVRALNGSLSVGITEMMGWGYVKSYEKEAMNPKTQAISTAIYFATLGIFKSLGDNNILDPSKPEDIQTAIENMPKDKVSILGHVVQCLGDHMNLPRMGIMFTMSLVQSVLTAKNMDEASTKEYVKNSLKIALVNTVLYELLNLPEDTNISKEASETIKELSEQINNNPDMLSEFERAHQSLVEQTNVDKLDSKAFIRQFKDKTFLFNLALASSSLTESVTEKWRKRNVDALRNARRNANNGISSANNRSKGINNNLSPKDQEKLNADLEKMIKGLMATMADRARANHGLGKIAGYTPAVISLNEMYVRPIKNKDLKSIPNVVLFYGPSGVGKTAIGRAASEDAASKLRAKSMSMNEEKDLEWIKKRLADAEKDYQARKVHTTIQLNEFDDFLNSKPELLSEFLDIIRNSAQRYHTTFFITTNNPRMINDEVLKCADIILPMGPATKQDAMDIARFYLGQKNVKDINWDKIADKLDGVKPNFAYSNAQIETIFSNLPDSATMDDVLRILGDVKPLISKETMDKFSAEQAEIGVRILK